MSCCDNEITQADLVAMLSGIPSHVIAADAGAPETVLHGQTVTISGDTCLQATVVAPDRIELAPVVSPAAGNGLMCTPAGLFSRSDTLVANPGGSFTHTAVNGAVVVIPAPPVAPPATVVTGGCLTGNGSAATPVAVANAGTWGYGCVATNGVPIHCDGTRLRGAPEHTCVTMNVGVAHTTGVWVVGTQSNSLPFIMANPSPCRAMAGLVVASISGSADTSGRNLHVNYGGVFAGTFVPGQSGLVTSGIAAQPARFDESSYGWTVDIPAGGTIAISQRVIATAAAGPATTLVGLTTAIRGLWCTV